MSDLPQLNILREKLSSLRKSNPSLPIIETEDVESLERQYKCAIERIQREDERRKVLSSLLIPVSK